MDYNKPKDIPIFSNYAYVRPYFVSQEVGPLGPIKNKIPDYGFDGLTTFTGSTAASGVSVNYTAYYMPYRGIIPDVEVQKTQLGKLMENAPEIRKK